MRFGIFRFPKHETQPPRHCPACAADLSAYPYYQLVPSPFARKLLFLARLLIPVMSVVFLIHVFTIGLPGRSVVSGYFLVAYICTPSLLVYSLTLLIPRMRRVYFVDHNEDGAIDLVLAT